jgi:cytochrome b6-f complex iron-sulfur subunit
MINRRNWLRVFWGSAVGWLALPASLLFGKKVSVGSDQVPKLNKIGGQVTIKLMHEDVLLIRDSERTVRIFNARCTHKGCSVKYSEKNHRIECPCHGSQFDLKGNVLKGPAGKPLATHSGGIEGNTIIVEFPD